MTTTPLCTVTELKGCQIETIDGTLGHVTDVLFDDDRWTIRYLVVTTGTWLRSREILLAPSSLDAPDWLTRTISTGLTRAQVESSPAVTADEPVSRQHEEALASHYAWPTYWGRGLWVSQVPYVMPLPPEDAERAAAQRGDPRLRSTREVVGYHLHGTDGALGHVEDVVFDRDTWEVRYLAVKTTNWWIGGHVLIAPRWVGAIHWADRVVDLRVTGETLKHCPTWTPSYPISKEYEDSMLDYYAKQHAWAMNPETNEQPSL